MQQLTARLTGWESLLRDALFYGGLHGRAAELTQHFGDRLRASLAEMEGVSEVDISELRLPTAPE